MATTIWAPPAGVVPWPTAAPIVQIKRRWTDAWQVEPELAPERATAAAAGHDLGSCLCVRRYGEVMLPGETGYTQRPSWDLAGWWLRLLFVTESGDQVAWIGRFADEARTIHGHSTAASGREEWVAYEPLYLLRRMSIATSIWWVADQERVIGWCPDVNARGEHRSLVGNRSAAKHDGTYLFGGTDLWTRYDFLEYVLKRFVTVADGPVWTIGGQVALLQTPAATDSFRMGTSQSVAEIVRALVPVRQGLDYTIAPTADGFEVRIYSVSERGWSFGGVTLAGNPNRIEIRAGEHPDMIAAKVVRAESQRYDRIRLIGRRIVVCCTLWSSGGYPSLVPKWSLELENLYKQGTGTAKDSAQMHDRARQRDLFRPVYQACGAPADWDHQAGWAAPLLTANGASMTPGAHYQQQVRSTLSWLPLYEGIDYANGQMVDRNPAGHTPDLLPPMAWVWDTTSLPERMMPVEEVGIHLHAPKSDWGVFLQATPNHLLAKGHWSYAAPTATAPAYDYLQLYATIAFEADQRALMVYEFNANGESCLDVEAEDGEIWLLAPETRVGIDAQGNGLFSGPNGRILRNDLPRMAAQMVGLLARYGDSRGRAEIQVKGLWTFQDLLGQILTVVRSAGDADRIGAPITQVDWEFRPGGPEGGGTLSTTVRAGFAG